MREGVPAATDRSTPISPIYVGTMALQPFVARFDMQMATADAASSVRVGLAQKRPLRSADESASRRAASCTARRACVGHQSYVAHANMCEQPRCSMMQKADASTGVCVFERAGATMLATAIALLVAAEIALSEAYTRSTRLGGRTAPPASPPPAATTSDTRSI